MCDGQSKTLQNVLCNLRLARVSLGVSVSSVTQSCPTLCHPITRSTPGLPVHPNSWSLPKLITIESVMPSNHVILCHPLLLLPSIFPSIRVSSNESALRIRWPKYWSIGFNITPSSEHPGAPLSMGFSQARILEWVAISFSSLLCLLQRYLQ